MKILFLQTGGTIDKAYPMNATNHGYNFEITSPAYERILQRIKPSFEFETKSILRKDSTDISEEDRALIVETCMESLFEVIVITHGTDTILQTAKALSSLNGKTIILTGSMSPEVFKDSDADFNLGVAIGAAPVLKNGIYVAMSGLIMKWDEIVFDSKLGRFTNKIKA